MNIFGIFSDGKLVLPERTAEFAEIEWQKHPEFKGVELKHIITAKDTDGKFSCHLVRIEPNCSIGSHIHQTQLEIHEIVKGNGICVNQGSIMPYESGTISIIQSGERHEVNAGSEGLYLFAKFIPALC
ncbi:MAG: AraC family ligand binding domain-containing protein [Lachnospiraceae bacterium]|nr:AraC family ligand binding domain-containing protein [Lachnospiraceae bacterium]MDE6253264.1 AraC family ligand binding domain-containing protein [Lachnospiraceae bacterium]